VINVLQLYEKAKSLRRSHIPFQEKFKLS